MKAVETNSTAVQFDTQPEYVQQKLIIRVPEVASAKLSSRGQVSVLAKINNVERNLIVEPDGRKGHWIAVDKNLQQSTGVSNAKTVHIELTQINEWPEPTIPDDFLEVLTASSAEIKDLWQAITPMARWEWVRWVNETRNSDTRRRRIEVSISKMKSGKRRPCCFNLAACTDPDVSKRGLLAIDV